jgi:glutamine amidotransferase/cyclase
MVQVTVLDYGAGNVRSVKNAIKAAGHDVKDVTCAEDIRNAQVLIFPGVGNFRKAMEFLNEQNYVQVLKEYVQQDKPFLGICLGMQTLFEGSEECPELKGLGIIKGQVQAFPSDIITVPHIGWNGINVYKKSALFSCLPVKIEDAKVYFVHSFRVIKTEKNSSWVLTTTNYGEYEFISSIQKGKVMATQFHPEKSGTVGISIIKGFLENLVPMTQQQEHDIPLGTSTFSPEHPTILSKRIIA